MFSNVYRTPVKSTYDYTPATAPLDTLLGYAAGSNQGSVCVPTGYDSSKPIGLFIYVNASDGVGFLKDYAPAFEDLYIIGAAAKNVGNSHPDVLRLSHSLDLMKTIMNTYNIDPERVYIGGTSGGVPVATYATMIYPELFKGIVCNVRALTTLEHDYFTTDQVKAIAAQYGHRMTLSTGPNDFNYQHVLDYAPIWRWHGYPVRLFNVPGMGHQKASLEVFEASLRWVDYPHNASLSTTYDDWSFCQFDERGLPSYQSDGDYDLDTVLNLEEYIFSSNPLDPLSVPDKQLYVALTNDVEISFTARSFMTDYDLRLGISTNLTNGWDYTESDLELTRSESADSGAAVYRYSPLDGFDEGAVFFKLRAASAE